MIYSIPAWVLVLVTLGGLAIGAFGAWYKRRNDRLGKRDHRAYGAMALGAVVVVLMVPTMANDRVILDEASLTRVKGFWFQPERVSVSLQGVESIRIETRYERNARGRSEADNVWVFRRADGATEEMPAGDLMDSVQDDLVERLEARGIRVADATD